MTTLKSFDELRSASIRNELFAGLNALDESKLSGFVLFRDENGMSTEVWIESHNMWLAVAWLTGRRDRIYIIEIKKPKLIHQKFYATKPRCSVSVPLKADGKPSHVSLSHRIFKHFEYLVDNEGKSTSQGLKNFFKQKTKGGHKLVQGVSEKPVEFKKEKIAVAHMTKEGRLIVKTEERIVKNN